MRDNRTASRLAIPILSLQKNSLTQERHSEVDTIIVFCFVFFFFQIVIRVRGVGIDVPVWVEREVLHMVKISDYLGFIFCCTQLR